MTMIPTDRHELVRRANVERVFCAIRDSAPLTRTELVESTGLSKPTVLDIVAALEDEGLIRSVKVPSAGAGRVPNGYEPDPRAGLVVGVDLGGTKVVAAVADLAGSILAEIEEPTSQAGGAAVVEQLTTLVRRVTKEAGVPWSRVGAVTVGTPGVLRHNGTLELATNIPGFADVPLAEKMHRVLRRPVHVDNDVNLAAIGECHAGVAQGSRTFVLLAIGTGVGAGVMIDGRLARGATGRGGEAAFLPLGADAATPESHRRGALEVAASGSGVQAMLRDELARRNGHVTVLSKRSDARAVFTAAAAGDHVACRVIDRLAGVLADAVLSIAALIDPELVVLGGGIGSNPLLVEPLRAAVARVAPWPVRIETSALGPRAGLVGALHHALEGLPMIEAAKVSARLQATT